ncbi:MAG: 23S rRNA (adenine(2503)-C(2))-methyltransferase RlmN [Halanaerobiales bacterium]
MGSKKDLKSLTLKELSNWLKQNNIKSYRSQQIFNWIYQNRVENFSKMTNLTTNLRSRLGKLSYTTKLKLVNKNIAQDGTIKYLWQLDDKEKIESVYLPYADGRKSTCISTQVGCAMNCIFCATGQQGFTRNLKTGEIIDQVLAMERDLDFNGKISNIVFMGMGEPMNNLEAVLKALNIFNNPDGLNIGMRKMTISTAGIIPGIKKIAKVNKQVGLAVSLNAPNEKLRNKIMPVNKKYPLQELLDTVNYYVEKTKRRVTFEYVIIDNVNDKIKHAKQLVNKIKNINCHVNLIPVNPVKNLNVKKPPISRVKKFKDILIKNGIKTTIRKERGSDIKAACGQLKHKNTKGRG